MATNLFNKTALANGTSNLIVRADALNQSTDLVQAGVVFNDAVRASLGLFNTSGSGNQNNNAMISRAADATVLTEFWHPSI